MPISVQCPVCGKKLKAPDQLAGRRVKCPNPDCGQHFELPHLATGSSSFVPNIETSATQGQRVTTRPSSVDKKAGTGESSPVAFRISRPWLFGIVISAAVFVVVTIVACFYIMTTSSSLDQAFFKTAILLGVYAVIAFGVAIVAGTLNSKARKPPRELYKDSATGRSNSSDILDTSNSATEARPGNRQTRSAQIASPQTTLSPRGSLLALMIACLGQGLLSLQITLQSIWVLAEKGRFGNTLFVLAVTGIGFAILFTIAAWQLKTSQNVRRWSIVLATFAGIDLLVRCVCLLGGLLRGSIPLPAVDKRVPGWPEAGAFGTAIPLPTLFGFVIGFIVSGGMLFFALRVLNSLNRDFHHEAPGDNSLNDDVSQSAFLGLLGLAVLILALFLPAAVMTMNSKIDDTISYLSIPYSKGYYVLLLAATSLVLVRLKRPVFILITAAACLLLVAIDLIRETRTGLDALGLLAWFFLLVGISLCAVAGFLPLFRAHLGTASDTTP